jgi:hypothetical protein
LAARDNGQLPCSIEVNSDVACTTVFTQEADQSIGLLNRSVAPGQISR